MHTVSAAALSALPTHLAQAVWPGQVLASGGGLVIGSGHAPLDAELPGGGWPCQSVTEILQSHSGLAEWRLLGPALVRMTRQGGSVLLIGPPHVPHLPGLAREGLPDQRLIRVDAHTSAERLWATELALKAGCVSAVLSWLPQATPAQIRRLQACAAQHPGLLFVFRPLDAQAEASAAPLRLTLALGPCPHPLKVQVFKRRGPAMAAPLSLAHWPVGLPALWPPSLGPAPMPRPPIGQPASPTLASFRPSPPAPATPIAPVAPAAAADAHVALDRPAAAARTAARSDTARRHRGDRRRGLLPLPEG